jgi:hypothetical protein
MTSAAKESDCLWAIKVCTRMMPLMHDAGTVKASQCVTCGVDTYSEANATRCTACPAGKVTNGMMGVTSMAGCVSPGGTWFDGACDPYKHAPVHATVTHAAH